MFEYYLVNYPRAIKRLESAITKTDLARTSVERLSGRISEYLDALEVSGICDAFDPGERERWIQIHRKMDFWRKAHEDAERQSVLFQVAHKAVLLYGTRSIVYAYAGQGEMPVRQEVALESHEFEVELPRLEAIDPVGHQHALIRFRSEPVPA